MTFNIGDIFECADGIFPEGASDWCNNNRAYIEEIEPSEDGVRRFQIVAIPEPTAEELATQALAQAKSERANAVETITVDVDGMIFQGDETSQLRIARAIIALEDGETITWVLADDTIVKVSKEQLKQVLRKAGEKQTELWTKPYEA